MTSDEFQSTESSMDDQVFFRSTDTANGIEKFLQNAKSAETLEIGIAEGLENLAKLQKDMETQVQSNEKKEVRAYIRRIKELRSHKRPPAVIIVVGATGAGKSTLLNALFEEEDLIPTSCFGACTATAIVIAWNESEDPEQRYRFEAQFITKEAWRKDLARFKGDLEDYDKEVESSIKNIRSVYPQCSPENLQQASIEELLNRPEVSNVLGTKATYSAPNAATLAELLTKFGASNEVTELTKNSARWPLVSEIKIFLKAPVLSTGAVIVDLPGLGDSNVARTRVVEDYMAKCTRLWVVTPIIRARDDKVAEGLRDERLARQLKMGGQLNEVTTICSKTDDLDIKGMQKELARDQTSESAKTYQQRCRELASTEQELEEREAEQSKCEKDQQTVSAEKGKYTKKINRLTLQLEEKQREARGEQPEKTGEESRKHSPTVDVISMDLKDTQRDKKALLDRGNEITLRHQIAKKEVIRLKAKIESIKDDCNRLCLTGRNEQTEKVLKHGFGDTIRNIDTRDPTRDPKSNLSEEIRNYAKLGESLPVFCVSAKAFEVICGQERAQEKAKDASRKSRKRKRRAEEKAVELSNSTERNKHNTIELCFKTRDDTGIPALQSHCKEVTEPDCRAFLNQILLLNSSIRRWAAISEQRKFTLAERVAEQFWLDDTLIRTYKAGIAGDYQKLHETLGVVLQQSVYNNLAAVVNPVSDGAGKVVDGWHEHRNMRWNTYRAIINRDGGPFEGQYDRFDFNADLTDIVMRYITSYWEYAFQTRIGKALQNFKERIKERLRSMYEEIEKRVRVGSAIPANINEIKRIHANLKQSAYITIDILWVFINKRQRTVMMSVEREVRQGMQTTYESCKKEKGSGHFQRTKDIMVDDIVKNGPKLFAEIFDKLKTQLDEDWRDSKAIMVVQESKMINLARQEYKSFLLGNGSKKSDLAEIERQEKIVKSIDATYARFAQLAISNDVVAHDLQQ